MKKSNPDISFGAKLRELRENKDLTIDEFCKQFNSAFGGRLNKSTVSRYENGLQEPMLSTVKKIAEFFSLDPSYFFGCKPSILKYSDLLGFSTMPILSAFKPNDSIHESENIIGYLNAFDIDLDLAPFALILKDDSMAPRMCVGDLAVIAQNYEGFLPSDGDIMAVSIEGNNAIVRSVVRSDPNGIWLLPSNPAFASQFYSQADLTKLPVEFIGYVIGINAKIEYNTIEYKKN